MKIRLFTIPNFLTLTNLFCGCLSVLFLTNQFGDNYIEIATAIMILMIISLVCDFLDGMTARLLNQQSPLGTELDSLADVVSFGLVPGLMMMKMFENSSGINFKYLPFFGLMITLFSALRLAKFNIDTEQTSYFKGLNTPANTILIFSFFWIKFNDGFILNGEMDQWFLIITTVLTSFLLVSNIPIFSFKFKKMNWKDNHYKFVFLLVSLILLLIFQIYAIPVIITLYILISLIFRNKITHA